MRSSSALPAIAAVASTAVLLVALIVLSPETVLAAEGAAPAAEIKPPTANKSLPVWPFKPDWIEPKAPRIAFDDYDHIAALDAIRIALVEVGDGGTYVWHRRDGSFSGTAKPTTSFRNRDGQPCRHLVVTLQASTHTLSTEGIACRLGSGRWQLDG